MAGATIDGMAFIEARTPAVNSGCPRLRPKSAPEIIGDWTIAARAAGVAMLTPPR
jgi:hypothetical protein